MRSATLIITLGRTGGIFSEVSKTYRTQLSKEFRTAEHFRAIGSSMTSFQLTILPFPDNPATLKLSLLFFLSSLLSNFSYLTVTHAKRYEAFSTNVSHWSKCARYVRFPWIFRGPDPFCVPNLAVSRAKRANLGGGGAAKAHGGAGISIVQYLNICHPFSLLLCQILLALQSRRIFVGFIKQTYQIG
jgi:hypothetical protein